MCNTFTRVISKLPLENQKQNRMARQKPATKKTPSPAKKRTPKKAATPSKRPARKPRSSKSTAIPRSNQPNQPQTTTPIANKTRKLYSVNPISQALGVAQIAGIIIAILAFIGIIGLIVRHAYANRPSHTQAQLQATEYESALSRCGQKPYLVVTTTNNYNEKRQDFYTPGFDSYETRVTEPPASQSETKRFDCELDSTHIMYATPHYGKDERSTVLEQYITYATSKGMRFLAPSHLPPSYTLNRQTLSSTAYTAAYSAVGNEALDGYFTRCSLLRDVADRSSLQKYRTPEKTIAKNGAITLYGDKEYTIDNTEKLVARYAETFDMWCSFTQNGERYIPNEEITAIMSSFTEQPRDTILQATPVANETE
jgi:hypothetical protein